VIADLKLKNISNFLSTSSVRAVKPFSRMVDHEGGKNGRGQKFTQVGSGQEPLNRKKINRSEDKESEEVEIF